MLLAVAAHFIPIKRGLLNEEHLNTIMSILTWGRDTSTSVREGDRGREEGEGGPSFVELLGCRGALRGMQKVLC